MIVTSDVRDIVIDISGVRVNVFKEHNAMGSRWFGVKQEGIEYCEVWASR